jgi:aminoglycoside phosphotransferase (APT) family kinase protein
LEQRVGYAITELQVVGEERPTGGQSNDTLLFTAEWSGATTGRVSQELVLRRQPSGPGIFLQPDVVREANVLRGLAASGAVPVPDVLGSETDASVVGSPFFVMDRVNGRVPLARPSIHLVGWLPTLTAAERATMWDSAMDTLVRVHMVDWRATHAFLLNGGVAETALDAHLDRLVEWYHWTAKGRPFPITDAAVARLLAERTTVERVDPVLVWGDARVGNMIFGSDNRVAAAIDWEVASIGPRAIDLAHWLFFDEFATTAEGIDRLPGWPDRETTIAEYERRSGVQVVDLGYFELMEELFMATTVIRQADLRVTKGLATVDTRMGHNNSITRMLARRLDLPEPEVSPDYVAHRTGR